MKVDIVNRSRPELFKKESYIRRWFPNRSELLPCIKLSQVDMLPIVQSRTTDSFVGQFETVRFDQDQFHIKGDAGSANRARISGDFGRNQNDLGTITHCMAPNRRIKRDCKTRARRDQVRPPGGRSRSALESCLRVGKSA